MFSLSLSRIGRATLTTTVSSSICPRSAAAAVTSTASSRSFSSRRSQRRYSSSKPPPPPSDDSRGIETPDAPTKSATATSKENAKRSTTKIGRRKAKGTVDVSKDESAQFASLPSVPSTNHINPHVTTSVPPNSTADAFATIFKPRQHVNPQISDVIYTLSTAVKHLETYSQAHPDAHAAEDLRTAITQSSHSNSEPSSVTHIDGAPPAHSDLKLSIHELSKQFRAFHPPPPPVPMDAEVLSTDSEPRHKSYSTVLTIHETNYPNGERTYEAHTSPIVEIQHTQEQRDKEAPASLPGQSFLERMRIRQEKWENFMEERSQQHGQTTWRALSVKRQRKLKMKKHKYKKLMKRTRNLRKKLDKL
ncbi:MAG: hypothetical protein M1834_006833 [Cirrosporium novae-zelandiae]|nr:MAG: hypothetical protein M1834_006833 [Cirrosporium novae-zelandiae]